MAEYPYDYTVGETLPVLPFTIARDGAVVDLTDATVEFVCGGLGLMEDMTVTDMVGGEVQYHFAATDLSRAGKFEAKIKVTDGDGEVQYFPPPGDSIIINVYAAPTEPTPAPAP